MALIKCPECGKEISNKSAVCIHCGFPLSSETIDSNEQIVQIYDNNFDLQTNVTDVSESTTIPISETIEEPIGFTLYTVTEKNIYLECKKCSKVYSFDKTINFSKVTDHECVLRNQIVCPHCKNIAQNGSKIKSKPKEKNVKASTKEDDSGCLIYMILLCVVIGFILWMVTDGFRYMALLWLVFPISIAVFIVGALIYGLFTSDPQEVKQSWDKEKYSNYMFTCPVCGSKKVKRISTANRAVSVATTGLASGKIGKQYECDDCKHKW